MLIQNRLQLFAKRLIIKNQSNHYEPQTKTDSAGKGDG